MAAALFLATLLGVLHFPYDVDAPLTEQEISAAQKYYADAYRAPVSEGETKTEYETKYLRVAEAAAKGFRIEEQVTAFVKKFKLGDRPVLEIGSGRGYLQDVAENYTGLDISPSVARFYRKKFVLGSATAIAVSPTIALMVYGLSGCLSMCLIPNRHFVRLDGLHGTRACCFCCQPGIVRLGLPRVMKSDPMPISI